MIGLILCGIAFALAYSWTLRSLGAGLLVIFAVGYVYGIVRAQVGDVGAHFMFDASLMGLYAAAFSRPPAEHIRLRSERARSWMIALVIWPLVCMAYSPALADSQPFVVQLVGLRTAVLMIPCALLGARMKRSDFDTLAPGLAALNLFVLGVGVLEYVFGIEAFVPRGAVTDIVYIAHDIEGASARFYRIPSTFLSSHAYGGTMVLSLPFVAHGLESERRVRILSWAGIGAALIGAFLCGSRVPVVTLIIGTLIAVASLRVRFSTFFAFAVAGAAVAYVVATQERFQRFTTLNDTSVVRDRISMSVNMSFWDILQTHPLGAGLASAAGTSIPYFLLNTPGVHAAIGLENEYAHVLLEEGVVGLALWVAFLAVATFRRAKGSEAAPTAGALMFSMVLLTSLTGLIGTGILYAVPSTCLFLVALGARLAEPVPERATRALKHVGARPPARARAGTAGGLAVTRASR